MLSKRLLARVPHAGTYSWKWQGTESVAESLSICISETYRLVLVRAGSSEGMNFQKTQRQFLGWQKCSVFWLWWWLLHTYSEHIWLDVNDAFQKLTLKWNIHMHLEKSINIFLAVKLTVITVLGRHEKYLLWFILYCLNLPLVCSYFFFSNLNMRTGTNSECNFSSPSCRWEWYHGHTFLKAGIMGPNVYRSKMRWQ